MDQPQPTPIAHELRSRTVFFNTDKRGRGRVKHGMLKRYTQAWFPKLCFTHSGDVFYVDGFAGPGKYVDELTGVEEDGSPLVIYKALLDHCHLKKWNGRVQMYFIEFDPSNAQNLTENLKREGRSERVQWHVMVGCFADWMPMICGIAGDAPMFVFADPFGYSGRIMPMVLMRMLAQRPKTELLINVMDGSAFRWGISQEQNSALITLLLDIAPDVWQPILRQEGLNPYEKLAHFMKLYQESLKGPSEMHFLKFGVRGRSNVHVYHLLFVTSHRSGIESMKEAMWKVTQQSDDLIFSEHREKERSVDLSVTSLLTQATADAVERVKERFAGETATGSEIGDFILFKTLYRVMKNDLKRNLTEFVIPGNKAIAFNEIIYKFPSHPNLEFT